MRRVSARRYLFTMAHYIFYKKQEISIYLIINHRNHQGIIQGSPLPADALNSSKRAIYRMLDLKNTLRNDAKRRFSQ